MNKKTVLAIVFLVCSVSIVGVTTARRYTGLQIKNEYSLLVHAYDSTAPFYYLGFTRDGEYVTVRVVHIEALRSFWNSYKSFPVVTYTFTEDELPIEIGFEDKTYEILEFDNTHLIIRFVRT